MTTITTTTLPFLTTIKRVVQSGCGDCGLLSFGFILFVVSMWHWDSQASGPKHGRRELVAGNYAWTKLPLEYVNCLSPPHRLHQEEERSLRSNPLFITRVLCKQKIKIKS